MSNIKDPNEEYNRIKTQVIDILIQYDEHVRSHHENLILQAENMVKSTPLVLPKKKKDEPMKYYRYMTSPIFRTTVESLTHYILTNIKGK